MSILFIGPYRNTDTLGQVSRLYISQLAKRYGTEDVVSRPVYLSSLHRILPKKIEFITEKTSIAQNQYDICVQHLPLEHIQYMPDVASQHHVFPIIENIEDFGISSSSLDILRFFDNIVVQSKKEASTITTYCPDLADKISILDTGVDKNNLINYTNNKYVFDNYHHTKKLYFIGNFDEDEGIIKKIIFSLYSSISERPFGAVCVFFLDYYNAPNIELLENNIKNMRSEFGLPTEYGKEIFIFKQFTESEIIAAHKSCDIYLSLNEKNTLYLQETYARLCGNTVISLDDYSDIAVPMKTELASYSYQMKRRSISTINLSKLIKSAII